EVGNVVGSAVLSDSATISGGYSVGGSIIFTLTPPTGPDITVGSVTVTGEIGREPVRTLVTRPARMTSYASYSYALLNSMALYIAVNESDTTVTLFPYTTLFRSEVGNVVGSAVLSDSATISGGYSVGGSIIFTLTPPTGPDITVGSVTVTG